MPFLCFTAAEGRVVSPATQLPTVTETGQIRHPGLESGAALDSRTPSWGVEVAGLTKRYDGSSRSHGQADVVAVDNVDLKVKRGDFCVLLGPSGCGKTTLLRCVAGLEVPTSGRITVDGVDLFDSARKVNVKAQDRPVGMVFQNYALWPHLNVRANVAFPLTTQPHQVRKSRSEIRARADEVLSIMQIENLAERRISQLSGGQQQRVALARAIAAGNDIVLFDEPLSNIDAKVRERLREELRGMQRQLGFTAVYVTHDQAEAMEMGDQIAVLSRAQVAQIGSPREIYNEPANAAVARFVGSSNIIAATIKAKTAGVQGTMAGVLLSTTIGEYAVDRRTLDEDDANRTAAGREVFVVSRTNSWWISGSPPLPGPNVWEGTLVSVAYQGSQAEFVVEVVQEKLRISGEDQPELELGQAVWVGVPVSKGLLIDRD